MTILLFGIFIMLLYVTMLLSKLERAESSRLDAIAANYPVFPHRSIINSQIQAQTLQQRERALIEEITEFLKGPLNESTRQKMRDYLNVKLEAEQEWKELHCMLEGNAAVANGIRTVAEIEESYRRLVAKRFSAILRVDQELERWLEKIERDRN